LSPQIIAIVEQDENDTEEERRHHAKRGQDKPSGIRRIKEVPSLLLGIQDPASRYRSNREAHGQ
jgi:hypothetical protein